MATGWLWLSAGIALLIAIVAIVQFNRMTTLRNRCKESWADVDTELRRRYDLIPNLVATVKGYMAHEQNVIQSVVEARAAAYASRGLPLAQAKDERAFVAALDRLLAVAERYPNLKASTNFLQLQTELANTEDRIQAARRFYNANVRDYQNQTTTFPGSLLANMYGFRPIQYFQVESLHMRQPVAVQFQVAS